MGPEDARVIGERVGGGQSGGDDVAEGDHVIALGNVVATALAAADPLTYHARIFGTHRALEVAS